MGNNGSRPGEGGAGRRGEQKYTSGEYPPSVMQLLDRLKKKYRGLSDLTEIQIQRLVDDEMEIAFKDLSTIDKLNTLINRLYSDNFIKEKKATVSQGDLSPSFGVEGFERMNASSKNYDCLIHSFLTATCENFRFLNKESKDEFANFFRRSIFLNLPLVACSVNSGEKQAVKDIISSIQAPKGYLQENIIFLLAAQFQLNILTATSDKRVYLFNYHTAESLKELGLIPGDCKFPRKFKTTICIYTSGDHFEALRHKVYGYNLPEEDIPIILKLNQQSQNQRRPQSQEERNLEAALKASLLPPRIEPGGGRLLSEEEEMAAAIEASLQEKGGRSAYSTKKSPLNRKEIAEMLGINEDELNEYSNTNLLEILEQEGGGTRRNKQKKKRTRRQKRYLNLFK